MVTILAYGVLGAMCPYPRIINDPMLIFVFRNKRLNHTNHSIDSNILFTLPIVVITVME